MVIVAPMRLAFAARIVTLVSELDTLVDVPVPAGGLLRFDVATMLCGVLGI